MDLFGYNNINRNFLGFGEKNIETFLNPTATQSNNSIFGNTNKNQEGLFGNKVIVLNIKYKFVKKDFNI